MESKIENNLIEMFNLPKYIGGKSFAEASKIIEKKFEDRTDQAASETLEELMGRLAEAQEYIKMQESLEANSQEVPDMMNGQIPEGFEDESMDPMGGIDMGMDPMQTMDRMGDMDPNMMGNMFELGGTLNNPLEYTSQIGDILGLVGNNNVDINEDGYASGQDNTIGRALTGAKIGSTILPGIGTGVGAVLGAGAGIIGAKRSKNKAIDMNVNKAYASNAQHSNFYEDGGTLRKKVNNNYDLKGYGNTNLSNLELPSGQPSKLYSPQPTSRSPLINRETIDRSVDWLGRNYGEVLATTPIAANLLTKNKRVNEPYGSRLEGRLSEDIFDERSITNQLPANSYRALAETTGGSLGALNNAQIASMANRDKALSNAYIQAEGINRQDRARVDASNLGIDQTNLQLDEQLRERKAQNEGAYQSAKSAQRAALFEDIGHLGRELSNKQLAPIIYGYTWDGRYVKDENGKNIDMEFIDKFAKANKMTRKQVLSKMNNKK